MGALAQQATLLHRRLGMKLLGADGDGVEEQLSTSLPQNEPIGTLATGLYQAWRMFDDNNAWILVVVEEVNQNQLDQRFIEFEVERLSKYKARFIRLSLTQ